MHILILISVITGGCGKPKLDSIESASFGMADGSEAYISRAHFDGEIYAFVMEYQDESAKPVNSPIGIDKGKLYVKVANRFFDFPKPGIFVARDKDRSPGLVEVLDPADELPSSIVEFLVTNDLLGPR